MLIAQLTKGSSDNAAFFTGNKNSPWMLVAFGMIGASLSGVTFISIPGGVGKSAFAYMQIVLGYLVGYFVIATVLIPAYYRLNLISIYSFMADRFGTLSHKTASAFFLLSKIVGASFRVFLVAGVMQYFVFDYYGIPFIATTALTVLLIWIYTFQGGIKTIVFTDTLQTFFMLSSLLICIVVLGSKLGSPTEIAGMIREAGFSKTFFFDNFATDKLHFGKQFLSGALIALVMTGLDQDMMQKNLTCKNIQDAQKNIFTMSVSLIPVNLLFLILGAIIYLYATTFNIEIPARADYLFPEIAFNHLPLWGGLVFLLGLTAAAYSSADSALTALTTAFCVDFLGMDKTSKAQNATTRRWVHVAFSVIMVLTVWFFDFLGNDSVINQVFTLAGYTYGPLLGLFSFGMLTKRKVNDYMVPVICILSPVATYFIGHYSPTLINYTFGFELLLVNGFITFAGLWVSGFFLSNER
jgi:Na+/proline symporter